MGEYEKLQWFLIKSFILLLAAVGAVEYVLLALINAFVMPVIASCFFPFAGADFSISGFQTAFVLVLVFLIVIEQGLQSVLPPAAGTVLQWAARGLDRLAGRLIPAAGILGMDGTRRLLLLLFLFAVVLVMALPFLAAAVVYARIVTRQFARIQKLREEARTEYDRKRNLMLSDIAHDLRTPITTVAGYAAAISDGLVSGERQREYLEAIRNKSASMNDLITLLSDYVKLDSAGFSLNRTMTDLCELARENAALLYADIEAAGMELAIEIPEVPIEVSADRLQISRVITNLLTNAVRHNRKGTEIGLYVGREEELIWLAVADTGETIDGELAAHLFEPFTRGDPSRSGAGSGLGLSIAKKAVTLHGWELALVQSPAPQVPERYKKAFLIRIRALDE